jgi:hypothetical protein
MIFRIKNIILLAIKIDNLVKYVFIKLFSYVMHMKKNKTTLNLLHFNYCIYINIIFGGITK